MDTSHAFRLLALKLPPASDECTGGGVPIHFERRRRRKTCRSARSTGRRGVERTVQRLVMDVQGFEDEVTRGAQTSLSLCRIVITELSVRPLYLGSSTFESTYQQLRTAGFELVRFLDPLYRHCRHIVQIDGVVVSHMTSKAVAHVSDSETNFPHSDPDVGLGA